MRWGNQYNCVEMESKRKIKPYTLVNNNVRVQSDERMLDKGVNLTTCSVVVEEE
jgi:hypothetical protein